MATKKSGRHRGRQRDEYVHYFVAVGSWQHYYGFSSHGRSRHEDAGYRHTETLTLSGRMVLPERFRYRYAEVTLSARDNFVPSTDGRFSTIIGAMHAADDTLYAYIFVPDDHTPQLVAVAASGRVRVVSFTGTPLKRRSGTISAVSVSTSDEDLTEDDSQPV